MYKRDSTSLPEHALHRQAQLVLVLKRSLRRAERVCRRDFVLLLGSQVEVPELERALLEHEGVRIHTVPPLLQGVPTADKLWAWSVLREYSQCVLIDSDVMVLRSIDDIFGRPEEVTIAHHAYDNVQAQCGIPLEGRGIAAMFAMRPSQRTFDEYVSFIGKKLTKPHQLMYADQTALMCFFGANRTRALPCSYLHDVANPLVSPGATRWFQNCNNMLGMHLTKQCLDESSGGKGCLPAAGIKATCKATLQHLSDNCAWRQTASEVRSVHFKGKAKPWPFSRGHANNMCRRTMHGPVLTSSREVSVDEDLEWDQTRACLDKTCGEGGDPRLPGTCVTAVGREPVFWGLRYRRPQQLALARKCCNYLTLLQAEWTRLLTEHPRGKPALPPPVAPAYTTARGGPNRELNALLTQLIAIYWGAPENRTHPAEWCRGRKCVGV